MGGEEERLTESSVLSSSSFVSSFFSFFQSSSSSSSIGDDSVHQSVLNQEKESKELLETKLYAHMLLVMVVIVSINQIISSIFLYIYFLNPELLDH